MRPDDLYAAPNGLAAHYAKFDVARRLLLTGHSHQAWPDCAIEGHVQAFEDAALHVDDKWSRAFEQAERVRRGFAERLDDGDGHYALGSNTHELLVRFLSALPLRRRPRIVTTDAEFHSATRQLRRLEEEGVEVAWVPSKPLDAVAERLAAAVDDRTACVVASSVFFSSSAIVHGLGEVLARCVRHGAELLVDAYHQVNVVPLSLRVAKLEDAYVLGGGYKYCQLGEGNCFLRTPQECALRPVATGWFAAFDELDGGGSGVTYAPGPSRFAGATYDPTSHYRAARVFDFFDAHALTPALLREVSQHQLGVLWRSFEAQDLDPAIVTIDPGLARERRAGFLALQSPHAADLCAALKREGVHTDSRGEVLRFGPAPYLSDAQLEESMARLGKVARAL